MIKRSVLSSNIACLAVLSAFGFPALAQDYKLEPIATAAPNLPSDYTPIIQTQGYRVVGASGPWCEVWLRKAIPTAGKPADDAIVFGIPQGTLLGVLRFPGKGADRRGQVIPAGLYTLRYSYQPVDGAHQGASPQRDFALLSPIAGDPDPAATPAFADLVQMSLKASGSPHPAVLSMEAPSAGARFPAVAKEGAHDWTLSVKVGELAFTIILVGKAEG